MIYNKQDKKCEEYLPSSPQQLQQLFSPVVELQVYVYTLQPGLQLYPLYNTVQYINSSRTVGLFTHYNQAKTLSLYNTVQYINKIVVELQVYIYTLLPGLQLYPLYNKVLYKNSSRTVGLCLHITTRLTTLSPVQYSSVNKQQLNCRIMFTNYYLA